MHNKQQKHNKKKEPHSVELLRHCYAHPRRWSVSPQRLRSFTHSKLTSQLATSSGRLGEASKCIKPISIGKHKSTSSKRRTTTTTITTTTTMLATRTATFMITKMQHQQLLTAQYRQHTCAYPMPACGNAGMWMRMRCLLLLLLAWPAGPGARI